MVLSVVVGPHDADQGDIARVRTKRPAQTLRADYPDCVGLGEARRGPLGLNEELDGIEDGVVLRSPDDQSAARRVGGQPRGIRALDSEVVGLGAARGEDDLAGQGTKCRGDPLARLLDDATRCPPRRVDRRRVTELLELLQQRRSGCRKQRGGRGVVEVDGGHPASVRSAAGASSGLRPCWPRPLPWPAAGPGRGPRPRRSRRARRWVPRRPC